MKYVFFGSPRFAAIVLEELLRAGVAPAVLVANPDRPVGRKHIVTPPQTKQLVLEKNSGITILQPEKLDQDFVEKIKNLEPDFFVVAAYAKIIPHAVLAIPRLGTLGVHPSLLPKYRGASPIQSAILNGETETGATIYLMDEKMDHGAILAQNRIPLSANDRYPDLEEKLASRSGELLLKVIPDFVAKKIAPKPQDENLATYTKKITTEDGFVDEKDLVSAEAGNAAQAAAILRKINALNPEPGCWTLRGGKRMKLLEANINGNRLILAKIQNEGERPKSPPPSH